MIYFDNTQDEQRVSIPRSIASETAPTGPYRPGDGIYINDNTISVTGRQETLLSGVNLKTLNGQSLLGQGDIVITPGSGSTYTPGANIEITENNVINVTGITSFTGVTEQQIVDALGAEPLTGITSGDVTTALGYTPISAVPDTYVTDTELQNAVSGKQETLISGQNIRTINGLDILGEGNIVISGGTGGTSYSAGNNIEITENNVINVTGVTSCTKAEITNALGAEPLTGITSGDVVTALGYVPSSGGSGSFSAGSNIDITSEVISVTGINKTYITTALGFTPVSSTTITEIWSGTQNQYDAITAKSSTTLYLVHE